MLPNRKHPTGEAEYNSMVQSQLPVHITKGWAVADDVTLDQWTLGHISTETQLADIEGSDISGTASGCVFMLQLLAWHWSYAKAWGMPRWVTAYLGIEAREQKLLWECQPGQCAATANWQRTIRNEGSVIGVVDCKFEILVRENAGEWVMPNKR